MRSVEKICGTLISGGRVRDDAVVTVTDGRIAQVVTGPAGCGGQAFLMPGFVDQHSHGGGGADVAQDAARVAAFHLRHGTTSLIASLVTAPPDVLRGQVQQLGPLVADDVIGGVHLEGPWLSPEQCGAHDVTQLRSPDPRELAPLLVPATVRMVTFAPELPGALAAIRDTSAAGVVAAIGHTGCDYTTAVAAIEAGARVATHLFNRMPHLGKRHPGPVLALLEDPRVRLELVADGVHVDPHLVRYVVRNAGAGRVCTVTDAMSAAGMPDGDYRLGPLPVRVQDAVARLPDGALAGSTLTLDVALRNLVAAGVPLVDAVTTLTRTPAQAMGLADRGVIEPGRRADVLQFGPDLTLQRVMRSGTWVL